MNVEGQPNQFVAFEQEANDEVNAQNQNQILRNIIRWIGRNIVTFLILGMFVWIILLQVKLTNMSKKVTENEAFLEYYFPLNMSLGNDSTHAQILFKLKEHNEQIEDLFTKITTINKIFNAQFMTMNIQINDLLQRLPPPIACKKKVYWHTKSIEHKHGRVEYIPYLSETPPSKTSFPFYICYDEPKAS